MARRAFGPLDRQTMAALGATGANDAAAALGLHAHEKAVGALAAHDGRLVGTFHGPPLKKFAKNLKLNTISTPFVNGNALPWSGRGRRPKRIRVVDNFAPNALAR